MSNTDLISIERVKKTIYVIRGEKVMLDHDLAELYQVQTKALNQAVRRNADRFPPDFMFQLSEKEVAELNRSQFVTGSEKHRDPSAAFTTQSIDQGIDLPLAANEVSHRRAKLMRRCC